MNTNIVIGIFGLFVLIILFSSFQSSPATQTVENKANTVLQQPTSVLTISPTPTVFPIPTTTQLPNFRVNSSEREDE